jgi:hypothetical protein
MSQLPVLILLPCTSGGGESEKQSMIDGTRTGLQGLPFSSLGDSVNNMNIKSAEGLFAHVVTGNARTFELVEDALVKSGLPKDAINLAAVPAGLGLFNDMLHLGGQVRIGTYFETVLRLFRFKNQTAGDEFLKSHPPVYYLQASHGESAPLPMRSYKPRTHADNRRETHLEANFTAHAQETLERVGRALSHEVGAAVSSLSPVRFTPLKIVGLQCLERGEDCLGDCPDAAYFGPHVLEDSDRVEMLRLATDAELHLVMLVNHRHVRLARVAAEL